MQNTINLPRNVNINAISFGAVKALENGGKSVFIGYDNKPLIIQTPEMLALFGSSCWSPDGQKDRDSKHTVELSFKGMENNKSLQHFANFLDALDKSIVEAGLDQSSAWFKKKYTNADVVAALYTPLLKRSKNKETGEIDDKYPPTFRISLPLKDGKYMCQIYDKARNPISLDNIDKGSKVTGILQCSGIWLAGGKFGCSWRVIQLRVESPEAIRGYAFNDDNQEEEDDCQTGGVRGLPLIPEDDLDDDILLMSADDDVCLTLPVQEQDAVKPPVKKTSKTK